LGIVEDAVTKFEVCGMFFEVLIGIVDIVRQSTLLCGTCAFVRSNPYAGVALLVILGGIAFSKRKVSSLAGPTGTGSLPATGSPAVGPEAVGGPAVVGASASPAAGLSASRPPLQARGKD